MSIKPVKDQRIALIGGAGFIGHHLALALKKEGAHVEVIDGLQVNNLLSFASREQGDPVTQELYYHFVNDRLNQLHRAGIPVHIQDAREYHALSHLLGRTKPHSIVHLAAVAHAGKSNKDPFSTFDHSFRTLENALDNARGVVEHFVYFSSSMVYGHFNGQAVTEDTICNPLGIYGALKFAGEKLVEAYGQVFDLPHTIIRPSALYGERCVSRRVGQIFIENAMRGDEVTVHGDGSDCLDFTYIDDLVQGILKVLENDASKGQTFNLTYGEGRSIADWARILQEHFQDVKVNYVGKDKLTPDRGTLSVDKARKLIGYEPQWPLEKGVPKYIQWYKSLPPIHGEPAFPSVSKRAAVPLRGVIPHRPPVDKTVGAAPTIENIDTRMGPTE